MMLFININNNPNFFADKNREPEKQKRLLRFPPARYDFRGKKREYFFLEKA
jgi:hypothetical protein